MILIIRTFGVSVERIGIDTTDEALLLNVVFKLIFVLSQFYKGRPQLADLPVLVVGARCSIWG